MRSSQLAIGPFDNNLSARSSLISSWVRVRGGFTIRSQPYVHTRTTLQSSSSVSLSESENNERGHFLVGQLRHNTRVVADIAFLIRLRTEDAAIPKRRKLESPPSSTIVYLTSLCRESVNRLPLHLSRCSTSSSCVLVLPLPSSLLF